MRIFIKRSTIMFLFVLSVLSNSSAILFSISLMNIIDSISTTSEVLHHNIVTAIAFLFLNIVFNAIFTVVKNKYIASCSATLKVSLITALYKMPVQEFLKTGKEHFESFFMNDLKILEEQYIRKAVDLITSATQFVLSIIAIALIKPMFLLLPAAVIFVSVMTPILFMGIVRKNNESYSKANSIFLAIFGEILSGFIVIKNLSIGDLFVSRAQKAIEGSENSYASYLNSMYVANITFAFTGQLLLLASFAIGGIMAASGTITTGSIVSLSQLLVYTIEPLALFAGAATSYASVKGTLAECIKVLSHEAIENNCEKNSASDAQLTKGDIIIKNLSMIISETNSLVLDGITLNLVMGKKYALIGKNGSGKSTLLKILSGVQADYSGEIWYNAIESKNITAEQLNTLVTYSPQDTFIFSMKLRDNIIFDKSECADQEIWITRYLEMLKISISPNQLISYADVSGGERAKICLLRSLYKDSPYLFLDEPTAAMDEESCEVFDKIIQSLNSVLCVVVTHRVDSSLRNFDFVIILENGKVVAVDPYDSLLSAGILKEEYSNDRDIPFI